MNRTIYLLVLLAIAGALWGDDALRNTRGFGERWDDLSFPVIGVNPTGPATSPGVDTVDGTWLFSGTADNVAALQVQGRHSQVKNTYLDPHIHVQNTTAATGTTRWRLEWECAGVNQKFTGAWASETTTVVLTNSTQTHQIFELPDINTSGAGDSYICKIRLSRLASSDAADNYTQDCRLLAFDCHFKQQSLGSVLPYGDQ